MNEKKEYKWEKGQPSPNPAGRPKGKGRSVSRLRKTQTKLEELQPKALENISKSVNGENVDKEILATSKWVIGAIVTVSKAALSEEESRKISKEEEEPEEKTNGNSSSPRFTTQLIQ